MTRKTLKITLGIVAILLVALTAGVVVASTKSQAELPEYLGSQSCLGCHADKYVSWDTSLHAGGVTEFHTNADLPLDPSTLPAELQAELNATDYIFHGYRFFQEDPVTGELKYTGIEFDRTKQVYAASTRKGNSWDATCGGCHAGVRDAVTGVRQEPGIGCESCHGPGREHILGKGDISKIYSNVDPTKSCAACHSGYNQKQGASRFPVGYRPGMTLDEVGFVVAPVDPNAAPAAMHHKGAVPQWQASAHANAAITLNNGDHTQDRCYACHSSEYQLAQENGQPFSVKDHPVNDGVTCVTCHDPHGSTEPGQLRKPAQELCMACHNGGGTAEKAFTAGKEIHHPQAEMLNGYAAIGVTPTKGAHSEVTCVECHMTDGNHLMKLVKPADVMGTTRKDSCSACHTDSSPESRDIYLTMWQESVESKLVALKADIDVIDAALKANPEALSAELKATYAAARTNWTMVEADKSKGAHNFEYATKILAAIKKDLATVKAALPQ